MIPQDRDLLRHLVLVHPGVNLLRDVLIKDSIPASEVSPELTEHSLVEESVLSEDVLRPLWHRSSGERDPLVRSLPDLPGQLARLGTMAFDAVRLVADHDVIPHPQQFFTEFFTDRRLVVHHNDNRTTDGRLFSDRTADCVHFLVRVQVLRQGDDCELIRCMLPDFSGPHRNDGRWTQDENFTRAARDAAPDRLDRHVRLAATHHAFEQRRRTVHHAIDGWWLVVPGLDSLIHCYFTSKIR